MHDALRIAPDDVRKLDVPLLVCAYENEEKCRKIRINGSISLRELRSRIPDIPRSENIVFFCT